MAKQIIIRLTNTAKTCACISYYLYNDDGLMADNERANKGENRIFQYAPRRYLPFNKSDANFCSPLRLYQPLNGIYAFSVHRALAI